MVQNKAFIYKSVPHGWPEPGKDLAIESTDFNLDAAPPKNGFTTKNIYAAFDPSQRGRMRDPSIWSYSAAMQPGKPVESVTVAGKVLKSDNADFKEGDIVLITTGYIESYSAVSEDIAKRAKVVKPAPGVPLTAYLGALGMTGMTAYGSLHEIGRPKKGDVIWVSGAAGAVGQVVGQIAVREGLTVIGSVGDDKKLDFITKELGFTAGFNYKKESPADALKRLAPDGIDIFYDNVGGEQLDVALANMKLFGRIVACGAISQYNNKTGEAYGVKNTAMMVRKRIRWQGFLVYDADIVQHQKARDENISKWIAEGSFRSTDYITNGMDNAIEGFLGMLKGDNLGKSILKISDE
ncbi:hypothetical protein H2198_010269 [Neophaeococcomyces mojaviensis]|uniref:Uncharacterized protein n=1 Tax=Neophaeococcomyces mojaviensis TaxID=3383035 RepID=A0ACC2ZSG5_9EURO|nr:hypothetical protein H2198_010269 [Knufia sp. JES_112]